MDNAQLQDLLLNIKDHLETIFRVGGFSALASVEAILYALKLGYEHDALELSKNPGD
jgi:hypothetical protein